MFEPAMDVLLPDSESEWRVTEDMQIQCVARYGQVFAADIKGPEYWGRVWAWLKVQYPHMLDYPTAEYATGKRDITTLNEFYYWQATKWKEAGGWDE